MNLSTAVREVKRASVNSGVRQPGENGDNATPRNRSGAVVTVNALI